MIKEKVYFAFDHTINLAQTNSDFTSNRLKQLPHLHDKYPMFTGVFQINCTQFGGQFGKFLWNFQIFLITILYVKI